VSGAGSDNSDRNEEYPAPSALGLGVVWLYNLGSKMAMGDQHDSSVRTQHVVILFEKPGRPYKEIGLVSSLGGWFASDGDNYHKMQMAAAQLGADAVIVQGSQPQSQRDYWQYPKPAEYRSNTQTDHPSCFRQRLEFVTPEKGRAVLAESSADGCGEGCADGASV
jgi:hypothetical protein